MRPITKAPPKENKRKQLYPFSDPPTVPGTTKDTNLIAPVTTQAGTKHMRTEII